MKLVYMTILVALVVAPKLVFAANWPTPSRSDCQFYKKLENQLNCKSEAPYLIEYGLPYCLKFQEQKAGWKKRLKEWVPDTTYCLQKELVRDPDLLKPCNLMTDTAFGSHPTCYMKSGFCDLNYFDKQRVMNVVAWVDVRGQFSQSVAQGLRIKTTCDLSMFQLFFHAVDYFFQLTRVLDAATRLLAAEIILATPTNDQRASETHIQKITYALLTGNMDSDRKELAVIGKIPGRENALEPGNVFDACTTDLSDSKFCDQFAKNNLIAWSSKNKAEFVRSFNAKLLGERIRMIHKSVVNRSQTQ